MRSKNISYIPIKNYLGRNEKINLYQNESIKKSSCSTNNNSSNCKINSLFRTKAKISIFSSNSKPCSYFRKSIEQNSNNKSSLITIYNINNRKSNNSSQYNYKRISSCLKKINKVNITSLIKTNRKKYSIGKLPSSLSTRNKLSFSKIKIHSSSMKLNNINNNNNCILPSLKNNTSRKMIYDTLIPKNSYLFHKKLMKQNLISLFNRQSNENDVDKISIENRKQKNTILSSLIKDVEIKKKDNNKELFKIRFRKINNNYNIYENQEENNVQKSFKNALYKSISKKSPFLEINDHMTISYIINDNDIMTDLFNRNRSKFKYSWDNI